MESQPTPQSNNAGAFASVYDAQVSRIYRYHYYRTRHRETAEDLTSQTFLKALEHFSRYDAAKASASTWLFAIARNTLIDHVRRARPSVDVDDMEDFLPSGEHVERDVAARQDLEQARALLHRLTAAQREIITLRLWDELSYAEIAQVTGKSEDACKMTFSRGLSALRKHAGPMALFLLILPFMN